MIYPPTVLSLQRWNTSLSFLLVCLSLLQSACSPRRATGPTVPEHTLTEIIAARTVLEEKNRSAGIDTAATRHGIDSLYASYGVNGTMVDETLLSYRKDLTRWRTFHEGVLRRLEELQKASPRNRAEVK